MLVVKKVVAMVVQDVIVVIVMVSVVGVVLNFLAVLRAIFVKVAHLEGLSFLVIWLEVCQSNIMMSSMVSTTIVVVAAAVIVVTSYDSAINIVSAGSGTAGAGTVTCVATVAISTVAVMFNPSSYLWYRLSWLKRIINREVPSEFLRGKIYRIQLKNARCVD